MKNKVLIAVDGSEHAEKAVVYAAGTLGEESQVTLYHVFEFPEPGTGGLEREEFLVHHMAAFKEDGNRIALVSFDFAKTTSFLHGHRIVRRSNRTFFS